MKKLIIAISAFIALGSNAQNKALKSFQPKNLRNSNAAVMPVSNLYTFSTFTAPYTSITGSVVTGGAKWDDNIYTIPVGFNFKLYSQISNTLSFYGGELGTFNDVNNDQYITMFAPMFEDLCDRSYDPNVDTVGAPGGTSPISYTTTGAPGSKICKIQVSNAGFFGENDANGTSVSSVNFQVWLYETSNDIEFRFGSINIQNQALNLTNGTAGFVTGLIDSLDTNSGNSSSSNMLNGNSNNPTVVASTASFTEAVTPTIANGRVYRFARVVPTMVKVISSENEFVMYPNPAKDKLYIRGNKAFSNEVVTITDISGKQVYASTLNSELDLKGLSKGVYLVNITKDGTSVHKSKLMITE